MNELVAPEVSLAVVVVAMLVVFAGVLWICYDMKKSLEPMPV